MASSQLGLGGLLSSVPRKSVIGSTDSTLAADEELLVRLPPAVARRRRPGVTLAPPRRAADRPHARPSRAPTPGTPVQVPRLVARIAELEEKLYSADGGSGGDGAEDGGLLDRFGGLLRKAQQGLDAGIAYV